MLPNTTQPNGQTAFHFANPKLAREANDWDSESHCADVYSFTISNREVNVTGREQSYQCGRQSTHWKILHSTSSKTFVGWWMPGRGQNWNRGVLELAPSCRPFWYSATDWYLFEFLYATEFWKMYFGTKKLTFAENRRYLARRSSRNMSSWASTFWEVNKWKVKRYLAKGQGHCSSASQVPRRF